MIGINNKTMYWVRACCSVINNKRNIEGGTSSFTKIGLGNTPSTKNQTVCFDRSELYCSQKRSDEVRNKVLWWHKFMLKLV